MGTLAPVEKLPIYRKDTTVVVVVFFFLLSVAEGFLSHEVSRKPFLDEREGSEDPAGTKKGWTGMV